MKNKPIKYDIVIIIKIAYRTELSRPKLSSIMKNIKAQNTDPGIAAIAAGYTMNTKPGPSVATCWIWRPET